jgi:hypothetical protein
MAKKRVPLYRAPQQSVVVDTSATLGATVGVDLFWPSGAVVTEAEFRDAVTPPEDGDYPVTYWRLILEIPPNVVALAETTTTGLYAITGDGTSATRAIELVTGELVGSKLDGVAGNPSIGLADVADAGGGEIRKFDRDAKGRVSGTSAATTDDLPEGASNLYFTDERAQDAVGAVLDDTGDVELHFEIVGGIRRIWATLSAAVQAALAEAMSSVQSVTGTGVDNTDPRNPVVDSTPYDDGTFTPTLTFSTPGDLSVAYTKQVGRYTRIGNRVFINLEIRCTPTFTTASGQMLLPGLPYEVNPAYDATAGGGVMGSASLHSVAMPASRTAITARFNPGAFSASVVAYGSAISTSPIDASSFTSGADMRFWLSGSYEIA